MEITGYIAALLIGISLGLIGGGGSILTVPVLTYLMGVSAVTATSYSLFIVGLTALVGAVRNYYKGNIEIRTGLIFAVPAIIAVWISRAVIMPAIPDPLIQVQSLVVSKDLAIMLFFAAIMVISALSMLRSGSRKIHKQQGIQSRKDVILILTEGLGVGLVTGLIGAGGGFLIIPALVLLAGIPMKKAIGTSLMIIALKSLLGFTGDLLNPEIVMDWSLLLIFTALSAIGIFLGIQLGNYVSGTQLKKGFGIFILIMGVYILVERIGAM